ncbi:MAG: D-alanyl-D-alanine carboxypeptidase, partial [Vulcanimicrobiaceae bacterium]
MLLALHFALSMQKLVDTYVSAPVVRQAHVGVLLTEASSHRVLAEHDADDAFTPASNMKLLVGSVAMARLGPSFTYQTRVAIDGDTLYLIGGGDAHLTTADLNAAA